MSQTRPDGTLADTPGGDGRQAARTGRTPTTLVGGFIGSAGTKVMTRQIGE